MPCGSVWAGSCEEELGPVAAGNGKRLMHGQVRSACARAARIVARPCATRGVDNYLAPRRPRMVGIPECAICHHDQVSRKACFATWCSMTSPEPSLGLPLLPLLQVAAERAQPSKEEGEWMERSMALRKELDATQEIAQVGKLQRAGGHGRHETAFVAPARECRWGDC